jgi:hypothetical protein
MVVGGGLKEPLRDLAVPEELVKGVARAAGACATSVCLHRTSTAWSQAKKERERVEDKTRRV